MSEDTKKVLIVEDHQKLMRFIVLGLKSNNFIVDTATSGQEALDKIISNEFDIIVLDIRLPDIDGFDVLRQLRKTSLLPAIAYSATPEYNARALECGANTFLPKPFDMDLLVKKIRELTTNN